MSNDSSTESLTIVGLWGQYIMKPQTQLYRQLPENEDITMHLVEISKISTVPHNLIRLKSGELAYISKRIDRKNIKKRKHKIHMEDMCQLTNRQTEHKYRGSYEQIAKIIEKNCQNSGLDLINYYELIMFCFLTGSNDMHLKNFSLIKNSAHTYDLCSAYDLVASELLVTGDDEELALNLNGRKRNLKKKDFQQAMQSSGINPKATENIFNKFSKLQNQWCLAIDNSFLTKKTQKEYKSMIEKKFQQLNIVLPS
ncbi:MAG: HipA domain-containing protein [Proteobacteria bacterium]|nr:HipA domain-containing protein [Pseudomonadota bacterium]